MFACIVFLPIFSLHLSLSLLRNHSDVGIPCAQLTTSEISHCTRTHSTTSGCAISVCRHLSITSVPRLLKLTNVIKLLLSTCVPASHSFSHLNRTAFLLPLPTTTTTNFLNFSHSVVSFMFRHSFYFNFCSVFLFIIFNVLHECVCACAVDR